MAPLTLAADHRRVCLLRRREGRRLEPPHGQPALGFAAGARKLPFPTGYGPTLVVQQDVVLLSVESRSMTALSAADGRKLWTAEHHPGGHMSPDDMLVIHGTGVVAATWPTGQVRACLRAATCTPARCRASSCPTCNPDWFHHRCYRSEARTSISSPRGTGFEFIDLEAKHWDINHWVRGGCLYGFMPANGLVYAPPHDCGCFLESKLFGLQRPGVGADGRQRRRVKSWQLNGSSAAPLTASRWKTRRRSRPASGRPIVTMPCGAARQDRRSCRAQADVADRDWEAKLSSVVVAGDKVLVAAIDAHTVHALDAGTGKPAWSYTAGGRVDSPPTVYHGRVLFGSADGWVYCLRAGDGRLVWRFLAAPADRRLVASDRWIALAGLRQRAGAGWMWSTAWPAARRSSTAACVWCVSTRPTAACCRKLASTTATRNRRQPSVADQGAGHAGGPARHPLVRRPLDLHAGAGVRPGGRSPQHRAAETRDQPAARGQASPGKSDATVEGGNHLFSRSGFLDDSWYFRSYWIYGKLVEQQLCGLAAAGPLRPLGQIDGPRRTSVYAFARKPEYLCNASVQKSYLYRAGREVSDEAVQRVQAAFHRINLASATRDGAWSDWAVRKQFSLSSQTVAAFQWARGNPPIQARGLVLAGPTLWVAGPPQLVDEEEALRNPDDPAIRAKLETQAAALRGEKGGRLLAISAGDGKPLAAYELGAMPTFDGLVAARERLYVSTVNGRVICLGSEGTAHGQGPHGQVGGPGYDYQTGGCGTGAARRAIAGRRVRQGHSCRDYPVGPGLPLSAGAHMGFALKKLPAPLAGKVRLKLRMRAAVDGALRNGFLLLATRRGTSLIDVGYGCRHEEGGYRSGPAQRRQGGSTPFRAGPEQGPRGWTSRSIWQRGR